MKMIFCFTATTTTTTLLISLLVTLLHEASCFAPILKINGAISHERSLSTKDNFSRDNVVLFLGTGIATNYTWKEDQFDIDVNIKVPAGTTSRNIKFRSSPRSVDLRLQSGSEEVILMSGERKFRHTINMDGTFWSISDSNDRSDREVTVHIEKYKPILGELEVDEDWKGLYPDDEDEVTERNYNADEELDIDEYCRSLGVDINNINMSMVDKSMFSVMNMTKDVMDKAQEEGFLQEVTMQGDGAHLEEKDGSRTEFSSALNNNEEITDGFQKSFEDLISKAGMAPDNDDKTTSTEEQQQKNDHENEKMSSGNLVDPIDTLTVAKLKEVLKAQKLKVGGTKKELQDRLKLHVQSMLDSESAPKE